MKQFPMKALCLKLTDFCKHLAFIFPQQYYLFRVFILHFECLWNVDRIKPVLNVTPKIFQANALPARNHQHHAPSPYPGLHPAELGPSRCGRHHQTVLPPNGQRGCGACAQTTWWTVQQSTEHATWAHGECGQRRTCSRGENHLDLDSESSSKFLTTYSIFWNKVLLL